MKLIVDKAQRFAKMRAHTATHLLHGELDKLLNGTKQAGSLVDEDYLRLDFTSKSPLTDKQIKFLEEKINDYIYQALPVEKIEISFEEAKKLGAKAFFDEKYGNIVRVIIVKGCENMEDFVSIELCGGTHVNNTADIGAFKIIGQEAVASGIRRIIAITGPKVAQYAIQQDEVLAQIASNLGVSKKQINDKIAKLLQEYKHLKDKIIQLEDEILKSKIVSLFEKAQSKLDFDKVVEIPFDFDFNFKSIGNIAKNLYGNINFLLYNDQGNFFAFAGKEDINLKDFLKKYSLKGGGNDKQIQGKDIKILDILQ